jgi:hypothetical protein
MSQTFSDLSATERRILFFSVCLPVRGALYYALCTHPYGPGLTCALGTAFLVRSYTASNVVWWNRTLHGLIYWAIGLAGVIDSHWMMWGFGIDIMYSIVASILYQ